MVTALDINQFVYRTGTLTIAPGDTTAVFTGTMLNSGPVKAGDLLVSGTGFAYIESITNDTTTPLMLPWNGSAVTNGAYVIFKSSPQRYHTVLAAIDTGELLAKINQTQIVQPVTGDAPDPSIGKENDLALKADITPWKLWRMTAGEWVLQDPPAEKGDPGTPGADGTDATVAVGDTVTLAPGEPAIVENVGTPGAAVLNFGIPAGAAATIEVGTVTTLSAGSAATVANVGTEAEAVLNFGIPKGQDGTGIGDVQGPSSSTDGGLVVFDGTDGKHVKALDDANGVLTQLGGTTVGKSLLTATDSASARSTIGAPMVPTGGTLVAVNTASGVNVTVPAGGTWLVFLNYVAASGGGVNSSLVVTRAGGSTIVNTAGFMLMGMLWRIQ